MTTRIPLLSCHSFTEKIQDEQLYGKAMSETSFEDRLMLVVNRLVSSSRVSGEKFFALGLDALISITHAVSYLADEYGDGWGCFLSPRGQKADYDEPLLHLTVGYNHRWILEDEDAIDVRLCWRTTTPGLESDLAIVQYSDSTKHFLLGLGWEPRNEYSWGLRTVKDDRLPDNQEMIVFD